MVSPKVAALWTDDTTAQVGDVITIHWEAGDNPPGTQVTLNVITNQGWIEEVQNLPLDGSRTYQIETLSPHAFRIAAAYKLNGVKRYDSKIVSVLVN